MLGSFLYLNPCAHAFSRDMFLVCKLTLENVCQNPSASDGLPMDVENHNRHAGPRVFYYTFLILANDLCSIRLQRASPPHKVFAAGGLEDSK